MTAFPWDRIVPISSVPDSAIEGFSCGEEGMDNWFLDKARTWVDGGFCQVYIALRGGDVVGFFALSPTCLEPASLSRKMRRGKNSMGHPGLLLGRIAVRADLQRSGDHVGSLLLEHAIKQACEIAEMAGGRFVVLDAKTDALCSWYSRFGFLSLKDSHRRMVLPMRVARDRVAGIGDAGYLF